MQQVTIRGLDPAVEKKIRSMAKRRQKSINQVLKETIHTFFQEQQAPASSLRELAGGWTRDEAREFERAMEPCNQIDAEMWK